MSQGARGVEAALLTADDSTGISSTPRRVLAPVA